VTPIPQLSTRGRRPALIVNPVYKPVRDLPGGAVEANESPHAACRREVAEELGRPPNLQLVRLSDMETCLLLVHSPLVGASTWEPVAESLADDG